LTLFLSLERALSLSDGNQIGDQGAAELARLLPGSKLVELRLSKCYPIVLFKDITTALYSFRPLRAYPDGNNIGSDGASAIAAALNPPSTAAVGIFARMSSFAIAVLPTSLGGSPASPLELTASMLHSLNLQGQNPELSQAAKDRVEQLRTETLRFIVT
jgi:hypothetical protein